MPLFQPPPPPRPEIKPPSAMERLAKFAAYPDVPTCPLDGHELDIHFHGGVECPACGAEFELGRNDELLPLKEHVEESAKMWPDTVPSDWKLAMAERTGDPTLDNLLAEFAAGNYTMAEEDWKSEQNPYGYEPEGYPVQSLRDPNEADWMCNILSDQFVKFLKDRGYDATVLRDRDLGSLGLENLREPGGDDFHSVVKVELPSGSYTVDWTAAQYGYRDEFPMVQKLDDGGWKRQWTSAMAGNPYPFLYSPTTGQLHWGWANGFHEPLKDRLRGQGERLADDYIHGRYYPESDHVRWYDPALESMPEKMRQPKDDMIRRNFPQTPLQSPLEAPGGHVTDGDDWTPQLNGFGF